MKPAADLAPIEDLDPGRGRGLRAATCTGADASGEQTALQRALRARDNNCCTFPGCHHRRFLYNHHVEHWANAGETNLDNLMLLCTMHHTLVHEGGFRIEKDFQDRWTFLRPDGIAVPEFGYSSKDMIDEDLSKVVEIPPAGGLLSRMENKVSEAPPPAYFH